MSLQPTETRPACIARAAFRRPRILLPVALGTSLLLAGCGNSAASGIALQTPAPMVTRSIAPATSSPSGTPSPSASTPATTPRSTLPSAPARTEEQKVLAAYRAYYDALQPISAMPAKDRPAALAKLTVDPLYNAVLTELKARDAASKIVYGKLIVKPKVALLKGDNAALDDCQDASQFGLMNKATGKKLTVGVKEFKQLTDMKRGKDGIWRLATVERTKEAKC